MGDQHTPEKNAERKPDAGSKHVQRGDLNLVDLASGATGGMDLALDEPRLQAQVASLQRQLDENPDLRSLYRNVAAIPAVLQTEGGAVPDQSHIDARQREALNQRVSQFATLPFEEQLAEVVRVANHMQTLGQLIELQLRKT